MPAQTVPLTSSWLESASYDEDTYTLTVVTRSGRTYIHESVMPDVFESLLQAPSPGQFYNSAIKGIY